MTTPTTTPIALTDQQLDAVVRAAAPLEPRARVEFLEELANSLQAQPELGDGVVFRVIAATQRRFVTDLRTRAGWHQ